MMFGIEFIAVIVLIVVVWRQHGRLRRVEGDLAALRKALLPMAGAAAPVAAPIPVAAPHAAAAPTSQEAPPLTPSDAAAVEALVSVPAAEPEKATAAATPEVAGEGAAAAPGSPETPASQPVRPTSPASQPVRPTVETALGTRWAVWVGGLALALGGIFLVRYTIEAGIFGPEVRLVLAAILSMDKQKIIQSSFHCLRVIMKFRISQGSMSIQIHTPVLQQ